MMGPGEALAAIAMAGVMIAVLITVGTIARRWIDFKQRKVELEAQAFGTGRSVRSDDYIELLEDRVRVLERIATDRGHDIAHQIEALRDRREFANESRKEGTEG